MLPRQVKYIRKEIPVNLGYQNTLKFRQDCSLCDNFRQDSSLCDNFRQDSSLCDNVPQLLAFKQEPVDWFNPLNAELNPICCLLALLGAHHFLHLSRVRVKSLTPRLLMSYIYIYIYIYIYGAPILDVSRSHTTTHHSR